MLSLFFFLKPNVNCSLDISLRILYFYYYLVNFLILLFILHVASIGYYIIY